jgi:hypothetical protein
MNVMIVIVALCAFQVRQHFVYSLTNQHCSTGESNKFRSKPYLLTYLLTPWSRVLYEKLTSKLYCQSRNSPHLWNSKVPHHTHNCPPPVPILSQLHPVPTTPSNFLKIHLNIILLFSIKNTKLISTLNICSVQLKCLKTTDFYYIPPYILVGRTCFFHFAPST